MKRILCLILIVVVLPLTSLALCGCKKDYKLKDFYQSYKKIAEESSHLVVTEAIDTYDINTNSLKIDIDYSQSGKLRSLVEDPSTKYYYLKSFYQQLLDDTLAPLYFFGDSISTSKKISDKQTNKLFESLNELKDEYKDIDYYAGSLITFLDTSNNESVNLSYLKKLFAQYEETIVAAGKLSALINDIYFNTLLSNSNINFSSKTYTDLNDADLSSISMTVRARMYYYKSIYANIYTQLYIKDADLAEKIIYQSASIPTYEPYNYISTINSLETKSIEALRNNKENIYYNIVSLYNIQNNFDKIYNQFNISAEKISYININQTTSTADELNYFKIMDEFAYGTAFDSYEILNNLVDLLYV